jgi:hypothetical protein
MVNDRVESRVIFVELENWMRTERAKFSRHNDIAKAMDYMLKSWDAFTRFLDDSRICLTNNAAERALRCVALSRRNWTFVAASGRLRSTHSSQPPSSTTSIPKPGSPTLLRRINDHPAAKLDELLPWHWRPATADAAAA